MIRHTLFIILLFGLGSCVAPQPIILETRPSNHQPREREQATKTYVVFIPENMFKAHTTGGNVSRPCVRFQLPAMEKLPSLPNIPTSQRDNYKYISNQLLNHVEELMDVIDRREESLKLSYGYYEQQCNG